MIIFLIRHGETAWNAARIIQLPDTPLNDTGFDQARRVAMRLAPLAIGSILSSDYARTRSTAEAIGTTTGAAITFEPLLRERHMGDHRGRSVQEIGFDIFAPDHAPTNGEDVTVFRERVANAWQALLEHAKNIDGNLAVVTHGLVLRALADGIIPVRSDVDDTAAHWVNTCVTTVESPPNWEITRLACADHLEDGASARSEAL